MMKLSMGVWGCALALGACSDAEVDAGEHPDSQVLPGQPMSDIPVGAPTSRAPDAAAVEEDADTGTMGRDAEGDPDSAPDPDRPDQALWPDDGPLSPDAGVPDDGLPADPGYNAGWIGGPCRGDLDCPYEEGYCLRDDEGYPRGICSQDCDRLCPDREAMPVTFCIDDLVEGSGACVQRCDWDVFDIGCRPGWHCETVGRNGEPEIRRGVCLPGEPPPMEMLGCFPEMDSHGLNYQRAADPDEQAPGADVRCSVEGPIRLSSPIDGVDYRYVSQDQPAPMFMACHLGNALYRLSEVLRELDVVEVGHIGTYNCRVISGTNRLSQHGLGLAIDLKWFRTSDGEVYDLEDHWEHETVDFRTEKGEWLYRLGRRMYDDRIFNIVLTPNYNAAHDNHFHVDLTADAHFIGHGGESERFFGPNPNGD